MLVDAPRTVIVGDRFKIRGSLSVNDPHRRITLEVKDEGHWVISDQDRVSRRGEFVVKTKAQDPGRETFRVVAERQGRHKQISRKVVIKVTTTTTPPPPPTETAKGDPNDWTYLSAGKSMRWDPCQPITWSYDAARQPYPAAESDVATALEIISTKTGLTFTRTGPDEAKFKADWSTPAQSPMLAGNVVGFGGASYTSINPALNGGTQNSIVNGYVTFDATESLPTGYGHRGWGQVMLHEVMHALGLGHAKGVEQVMYPAAGDKNFDFGAGDLSGLADVGAAKGCINTDRTAMRPTTMRSDPLFPTTFTRATE